MSEPQALRALRRGGRFFPTRGCSYLLSNASRLQRPRVLLQGNLCARLPPLGSWLLTWAARRKSVTERKPPRQPVGRPSRQPPCSPGELGPGSRSARLRDVRRRPPSVAGHHGDLTAGSCPLHPHGDVRGFLTQVGVVGLKPGDVLAMCSAEPITSPGAPSTIQGSLQTRLCQNSLRNVTWH